MPGVTAVCGWGVSGDVCQLEGLLAPSTIKAASAAPLFHPQNIYLSDYRHILLCAFYAFFNVPVTTTQLST